MTPAERRERARLAANERWARPGARERQSAGQRAAMRRRLIEQVDPDGLLSGPALEAAITNAAKAQGARLSYAKLRKGSSS